MSPIASVPPPLRADLWAGMRFITRHPVLREAAAASVLLNVGLSLFCPSTWCSSPARCD